MPSAEGERAFSVIGDCSGHERPFKGNQDEFVHDVIWPPSSTQPCAVLGGRWSRGRQSRDSLVVRGRGRCLGDFAPAGVDVARLAAPGLTGGGQGREGGWGWCGGAAAASGRSLGCWARARRLAGTGGSERLGRWATAGGECGLGSRRPGGTPRTGPGGGMMSVGAAVHARPKSFWALPPRMACLSASPTSRALRLSSIFGMLPIWCG